jgi:putative oxidoreductase
MSSFPFISLPNALHILRVATAIFFMAHAAVRLSNFTIPQFAAALTAKGWPFALAIVWAVTLYELAAGALMIANRGSRWCALGLAFIDVMGIIIIHAKLGWFVGEHGTGGVEYSLSLLAALIVIAAADRAGVWRGNELP